MFVKNFHAEEHQRTYKITNVTIASAKATPFFEFTRRNVLFNRRLIQNSKVLRFVAKAISKRCMKILDLSLLI